MPEQKSPTPRRSEQFICVSARATASLQAQDWPLDARGFDELQWDLMGDNPNGVCHNIPSPLPQQP